MDRNIDHVLKTVYGLLWRQMTKPNRLLCRQRIAACLNVVSNRSSWNQATYQLVFSHWDTVFTGLVPDHLLVVAHLLAAIIPVIFNVTSAPTGVEIAQIAIVLFVCRIIVEYGFRRGKGIGTYHTANLYWQSILFWIEETRALGVPLGHVLEGYFEADWKPVKKNREHSNYHRT